MRRVLIPHLQLSTNFQQKHSHHSYQLAVHVCLQLLLVCMMLSYVLHVQMTVQCDMSCTTGVLLLQMTSHSPSQRACRAM